MSATTKANATDLKAVAPRTIEAKKAGTVLKVAIHDTVLNIHARNYLAHNNIDMTQFFWGSDGKRTIIINVLDTVMIILYKLETMHTESS